MLAITDKEFVYCLQYLLDLDLINRKILTDFSLLFFKLKFVMIIQYHLKMNYRKKKEKSMITKTAAYAHLMILFY